MWVAFALLSALCAAGTTLMLKQAVARGGVVESTVAFRAVAGVLLALLTLAVGDWPVPTAAYWRAAALASISTAGLRSVEWVDGVEASARWGLDHGQGAIVLRTRAQ